MKWTLLIVLVAACQSDPDNAVRHHHVVDDTTGSDDDMPPPPSRSHEPHMPDQNPDYPTPRRAGTDELFRIENPQRGPAISPIQQPDAQKLQRTQHARCEVDDAGVVCSRLGPPSKSDPGWTVGTLDGKPVLYQHLRNGHVDESYVLEYDKDGALTRMTKMDGYGVLDWQRSYWPAGQRYTARTLDGGNALEGCGAIDVDVGPDGLADASTCLEWSGQPMKNTDGVSIEKWKRDDEGFVIEQTHFDVGGMPIVGLRDAVHTITWTRDRYENPMTERFADVNGKDAASHDEHGCYGVDEQYAHDVLVKETCVDRGGSPVPRDDGITIRAFDHDGSWCPTVTRNLDGNGNPAVDEDGVASIKEEHNVACDPVVSTCRSLDGGQIACGPGKPAEYRITYDKQGRTTDEKYSGGSGVDPNYDAPEIQMKYDALGRRLSVSCFSGGARAQCGDLGYHREESHWDDNGRETDEIYFNEDDSPASNIGIFRTKYTYDNYDHLAEEQGVDPKDQLYDAHGMAVRRYYYDDGHRLFGLILLDTHNNPAHYEYCFSELTCPPVDETWHALRIIRSPTGHLLSNEFFDADGNLIKTVDCRQDTCWGDL